MLMHWFPERKFALAGDGAYGTHQVSRFAYRQRQRLSLVSKFVPDANLFELPPKRRGKKVGRRPRVKGGSMPSPEQVVARTKKRKRLKVRWYGGGWRQVEIVSNVGHWFNSGKGLMPVRWVYVHDLDGTHRDEYFFRTDTSMSAKQIIEMYGGRWNIETTFQELREHLGFETTRGWHRQTVLRVAPSLMVLYSIVEVFYDCMPRIESQPSIAQLDRQRVYHVQRHDYQCPTSLMDELDFRTDARRSGRSKTTATRTKTTRLWAHPSRLAWKKSS